MSAEPKMEDLLASIRKAIHEDIGEVPAARSAPPALVRHLREVPKPVETRSVETRSAAEQEIQDLRDRINRSRVTETAAQLRTGPATRVPSFAGTAPIRQQPSYRQMESRAPSLRGTIDDYDPQQTFHAARQAAVAEAAWEPEPEEVEPPPPPPKPQPLLSHDASQATGAAFDRLADNLLSRATANRSLEAMTTDLLRGMLKSWLDDNLPQLVERLVREEIERVARRGR
ncbi:PopZ family protein [Aestuariivirga sp.]|uniref:PopZ family protein n=1 Tax=Aestuariivirga sp. TaxID=2650926 RepID=UPI0039E52407